MVTEAASLGHPWGQGQGCREELGVLPGHGVSSVPTLMGGTGGMGTPRQGLALLLPDLLESERNRCCGCQMRCSWHFGKLQN